MTPKDEAIFHEWQLKARMGIPPEERLNDNRSEIDLEATLRKIKELIGNRE